MYSVRRVRLSFAVGRALAARALVCRRRTCAETWEKKVRKTDLLDIFNNRLASASTSAMDGAQARRPRGVRSAPAHDPREDVDATGDDPDEIWAEIGIDISDVTTLPADELISTYEGVLDRVEIDNIESMVMDMFDIEDTRKPSADDSDYDNNIEDRQEDDETGDADEAAAHGPTTATATANAASSSSIGAGALAAPVGVPPPPPPTDDVVDTHASPTAGVAVDIVDMRHTGEGYQPDNNGTNSILTQVQPWRFNFRATGAPAGVIHQVSPGSLKATCQQRQHKNCVLWLSRIQSLLVAEKDLTDWLAMVCTADTHQQVCSLFSALVASCVFIVAPWSPLTSPSETSLGCPNSERFSRGLSQLHPSSIVPALVDRAS